MKFDKARNLVKFLLAMCLVFCVVGIAASGSQTGVISTFISTAFFVTAFIVIAVNCPKCRRNLITGAKTKGKKR